MKLNNISSFFYNFKMSKNGDSLWLFLIGNPPDFWWVALNRP